MGEAFLKVMAVRVAGRSVGELAGDAGRASAAEAGIGLGALGAIRMQVARHPDAVAALGALERRETGEPSVDRPVQHDDVEQDLLVESIQLGLERLAGCGAVEGRR